MSGPPLRLPGEHFVAGTLFLLIGAIGVIYAAPALAMGVYASPVVVGVTHLFTLGWLTTSLMGALYQFLPVALGQSIASERVAHATFVLHVGAVSMLVVALVRGNGIVLYASLLTLTVGITCFLANLGVTLHRAERRDVTWWAICCAAVFLGATMVLGAARGINLRTGFLGGVQPLALGTHLHIALAGWVLLVMVGVSHRLLPMFLLSHGGREYFARYAVALIASGAGLLAVLHHVAIIGREVPAVLIGAGVIAFLLQAREFYRKRHRRKLDAGLRLAAGALGLLAVGVPLAAFVLTNPASLRLRTAYVVVLVLACSLFVAAHYYKIVPFLIWNRHFGPLAGTRSLPSVADLYSQPMANAAAALLMLGAVTLIVTVASGLEIGVRIGGVLFATGAAIEAAQMTGIARRRP